MAVSRTKPCQGRADCSKLPLQIVAQARTLTIGGFSFSAWRCVGVVLTLESYQSSPVPLSRIE